MKSAGIKNSVYCLNISKYTEIAMLKVIMKLME